MRRSTAQLLDITTLRYEHGAILDVGSPDGVIAAWAAERGRSSSYFHVDLQACRGIRSDAITVYFGADLPPTMFQMVAMDCTSMDGPLACDLALAVARILGSDGEFLSVPPSQWSLEKWVDHLRQVYTHIRVVSESADVTVVSCQHSMSQWAAGESTVTTQFGGRAYTLYSAPGIFSPNAVDKGTLTMLEEIAKADRQETVLDLGCGIGIVGIHLASLWGCSVIAVDTNARALHVTSKNAAENRVSELVDVIASDGFSDIEGMKVDLIATNPPYHSDYSVAKGFISGAHRNLNTGGRLWVVVKRPDWYINRIRSVFGGCTVMQRNGYFVLTAEKRPVEKMREKPQTTTRKHLKRVEDATERKKSRRPNR